MTWQSPSHTFTKANRKQVFNQKSVLSTIHNNLKMKEPKQPTTNELINRIWYIYIIEYYSAIERNAVT